jgi:hypothetical protein
MPDVRKKRPHAVTVTCDVRCEQVTDTSLDIVVRGLNGSSASIGGIVAEQWSCPSSGSPVTGSSPSRSPAQEFSPTVNKNSSPPSGQDHPRTPDQPSSPNSGSQTSPPAGQTSPPGLGPRSPAPHPGSPPVAHPCDTTTRAPQCERSPPCTACDEFSGPLPPRSTDLCLFAKAHNRHAQSRAGL